ncbi:hypothetical protein [Methylobacterium sp. Leaf85]|uniref:hypothetical protein n=1 Tax=Methylobacterium sp. Leaf85 TaxID=1736241 RepID=UPI0006F652F5|nr:hypothetical protein [Methylobacterium sp. Leaf85]KQO53058.1 hypothetical protein ASF08_19225 [Methylobacterium sp. Leaf85]
MAENTVSREISSVTLGSTGIVSVVGIRRVVIEGEEFTRTFAESYEPGQDLSALPEKIQGICAAWWDDDVVLTHMELTEAAAAEGSAL